MNRNEMVEGIMRQAGLSKANVARFYNGLAELIRKELTRNKEFVLPGLGVLRVRHRKARIGRNPQTGEPIRIAAKKVVRFRAYSALDELLNGPRKEAPSEAPAAKPSTPPEPSAPESQEPSPPPQHGSNEPLLGQQ
jgi:DNA-binding protein HU-beta